MTPIDYFNDTWRRCDELGVLHTYIFANTTSVLSADEILRAEWVTRVSALDLYIHELVAQNMVKIFGGRRPACGGFYRFHCSTAALMRIRSAPSDAEAERFFELEVRNKLSRMTFQLPEDIADAIRYVSPVELWNEIALANGATQPKKSTMAKALKVQLSVIVDRRNKIVHEGDLQPTVPRTPWPIARGDVAEVLRFIRDLVVTIDRVV